MLFEMSEELYGHGAGVLQKSKAPFMKEKKQTVYGARLISYCTKGLS